MFVFDAGRRQTLPFDIWKTRMPQEEHVKYYFSGDWQKYSIYGSVTATHILMKVACLCGLIANFLLSSGTGKGSCHHWTATTEKVNRIYCTGMRRGSRHLHLRHAVPPRMIKSKPQATKFEIATLFSVFCCRNPAIRQYFITFYFVGLQTLKNEHKFQLSGNKTCVLRKEKLCGHKE
jgi:hypothetical protein